MHWNFGDYKNAHDALHSSKHDGLLVLAIFLELGESGNDELDKFLNLFGNISLNEQTTEISEQIDAKNLFPGFYFSFADNSYVVLCLSFQCQLTHFFFKYF